MHPTFPTMVYYPSFFQNALYIDSNIIQFRHPKANGTMNNHDGPGQQISREAFVGLRMCWRILHRSVSEAAPQVCDAILHPEEVKAALDMEDEEQRKLAEGYHKAFNVAMDTRRTIRP